MDDPLGETHLTQAGMNVLGPPQVRTQLLLAPVELGGMASPNRLSPLSSLSHRPTRSEVPLSSDFHQTSRSTYPPLSVFRSNLFKSLLSPTPYNSRTRSSLPSTHSVLLRTLYGSPFLSPVDTSESKRGGAHGIGGIVRRIEHLLAEHPAPHGRGLAPKRPYLDPLGLIEKHSPRTLSIGKFSSPDSSLRTTNNTGDDLDSKSGLCAAITPVLVDPCSPLSQPCCSLGSTLIKVETTSDTWIDREDMPNAQNLALSCPSSVTVVDYSGSQSVPDLSSLISNHPKELPSPASLESLALLLVSLPHMSSGYEVMLSIKATFLQGLSALAAMFPSISPSHRIKTPNIGHLCAPDYRLDVEPINSDGYCIRVKFKNPLSQHKPLDFVEYHFPAPKQTNIYDAHFQCGSLVAIDPVGYHHKLDKYSQFTIPGDEHKGALLMSPAEPKTIKVVDAPILVPCKIEAYPSVPLPTTVDDLQGQPATDKGEIGELGSGPLKQNKIFNLQDIVDRANHIQGHQSGSDQVMRKPANGDIREARHPDTLATAHPDVMNLPPPRQCRLERRWSNRRKRPKFNSCLAAPSYFCSSYRIHLSGQPIKSYSAGDGEPGGFGDLFDFSLYHSVFGGFPNDSGLTNGGEIWSGQGPGSELQQGLEMSDQLLYDPLDSTEPAPNILAPQPQYYDEGNLPVQEPFHVPSPPVPLPVNLQPNAHGSGWSAIEPAPNIAAPQVRSRDESGSATRPPSNTPLPINSQLDTRGPE
ncbi:unnamed protein product [Rhizoctonia solani]|uniref:Uncharacterized protein n=1 Tax=Rhizoctonia solani TaxID=456999 RepID=A0A8H3GPV3_9AGAM|nr:unnamed protein product [Rhizoctonia solani]